MLQRFAKLLFPMLLLCIVSLTVLVSLTTLRGAGVEPNSTFRDQMTLKEAKVQQAFNNSHCSDLNLMRQLALIYWQNEKYDKALAYLEEIWNSHANGHDSIHYDPVFVQDGLNVAGMYLDRGTNDHAEAVYNRLIEYDSGHLSATDPRLGRDYNNLALTFLRSGEANQETDKRVFWFKKSMEECKKAEKIFRASPQARPQLICCLQNQVVALSEMGDYDKALNLEKIVNRQLDAWHDHRDIPPPPDVVN